MATQKKKTINLYKEDMWNILIVDTLFGVVFLIILAFLALNSLLGFLKLPQLIGLILVFIGAMYFVYQRIQIIRQLKLAPIPLLPKGSSSLGEA